MQLKWNKPHDIQKRLVQCVAIAGLGSLLAFTAYESGNSIQAVQSTEVLAETETTAETTSATETQSEAPEEIAAADFDALPFSSLDEISKILFLQPNYLPDLSLQALTWDELEIKLSDMVSNYSGDWSIYIKNLQSGDTISINDRPQESASLIKLFIMGAVMEKLENGTLEHSDTIDRLLNEMITVSDNTAANTLVKYLSPNNNHTEGLEVVNNFALRHGYYDTKHINGLNDRSLWTSETETNQTSAKDCAELLSAIYEGSMVSHLASHKMENLLLAQEVTYKIPTALPAKAISANKTGETDHAENDSAIIYSPGGDFIICIMSEGWDSKNQAVDRIRELTKLTYSYFNPDGNQTKETEN